MSNLKDIKRLYQQNSKVHLPIYGVTRSKAYRKTAEFLQTSEHWTDEGMHSWVLKQIQDIVDYALKHVPYYKEAYKGVGLSSGKDIKTFLDFEKLPTVSKQIIKEYFDDFVSDEINLPYRKYCTSGTQLPFTFFLDQDYVGREQAYFDYYWKKFGNYSPSKDRCIILRGGGKNDKHFEYNQIYNYKLFDSDYTADVRMLSYYDSEIRKYGARFMQAYPSSVYGLAKNYLFSGMRAPTFDVIFLGSENVLQNQIETIQECFKPRRIVYHYGHSEEALLGIKYENDEGYGFLPQYGFCEVLNDDGKNVTAHKFGELTGTTWTKKMPFIRYRTNDFAVRGQDGLAGFPYHAQHIERIEGRQQEFVIRNDGIKVSIVSICSEHMPAMSRVKEIQFEQYAPGQLNLNCVFYNYEEVENISGELIKAMEKKFEGKVKCVVQNVEHVKKTNNGKTIMLVQHVK